jgi:AraC-like DNA-binding protein
MLYTTRVPGSPLSTFVEYLWSLQDAPGHAMERIVPSGTLELVVNLHEDELRIYDPDGRRCRRHAGASVSGAYRQFFVIDTREHASIVGVHFRPGTARAILGVPPGALADQHVDLAALWSRAASELRERLCAAATAAARFDILEQALRQRLAPRDGHRAVAFALEQLGRPVTSVGEVAARLQLSRRRLIEVFTAEVGMTPKRLSRVMRFQRASQVARLAQPLDWARVAAACGYFDQAHLVNEFRELTGMSPVRFVESSACTKVHHIAVR